MKYALPVIEGEVICDRFLGCFAKLGIKLVFYRYLKIISPFYSIGTRAHYVKNVQKMSKLKSHTKSD